MFVCKAWTNEHVLFEKCYLELILNNNQCIQFTVEDDEFLILSVQFHITTTVLPMNFRNVSDLWVWIVGFVHRFGYGLCCSEIALCSIIVLRNVLQSQAWCFILSYPRCKGLQQLTAITFSGHISFRIWYFNIYTLCILTQSWWLLQRRSRSAIHPIYCCESSFDICNYFWFL